MGKNIIRQGTKTEGPLEASKWLSSQALLDEVEMAFLLNTLKPIFLFKCGAVQKAGESEVPPEEFLAHYKKYIDELKMRTPPNPSYFRPLFSLAMTVTTETLFSISLLGEKEIIRISKPVIQMQLHQMSYSTADKKFHPMVFGLDSIPWGVQFSYPQLFRDGMTKKVETVKDNFPNTKAFHALQKWMRSETIPTPFIVEGVKTNVPMRLGKRCTSWINQHPHLVSKGIFVDKRDM